MSKISLINLANLQNETTAVTAINTNNATTIAAFDNTLSRDGTTPNEMMNNLDMNSFQILNLPVPSTMNSPARLQDVVTNPTINLTGTGATYTGTAAQAKIAIGTGSAAASWFSDINNALAYGLTTAGTASANGTALTSATASSPTYLPPGNYLTNLGLTFGGSTWGPGRWSDSTPNQRAPMHYAISSAPTYTGDGMAVSLSTVFNGDFTHVPFSTEILITGDTTAGVPTSTYAFAPPNQVPFYLNYYTESGYNHSASTPASGRTGQFPMFVDSFHNGQGDLVNYGFSTFVLGAHTNSSPTPTNILSGPAGAVFAGDMIAGAAGCILQVTQTTLSDGGFDVAGLGVNVTSNRTVTTGALGAWWNAYTSQSIGSGAVDVAYQATGPHKIGIDLSFATLPGSGNWQSAALTLSANQRIYLNATATDSTGLSRFPVSAGSVYIDYNGTNIEHTAGITSTGLIKSSSATGGVGYSTGAGGTVTQLTSKATGVTINKTVGQIVTFNTSMSAGAEAVFTVTNSTVAATDVIIVNMASGGTSGSYLFAVSSVTNGTFDITISNASGGTLTEALTLNFAVIKGVAS